MNRIYQGRVSKVEISKPGDKENLWQPFDPDPEIARKKWEDALWNHHELFQDAVNYYTVCLLALASSEVNPLTKIRQRIEATAGEPENEHHVWTKVYRKGAVRLGLRDSVAKYLTPKNKLSTPQECFAAVLKSNETSADVLDAALMQMLQACAGKDEGTIKQVGRDFWPTFCDSGTGANFGGDMVMLAREDAKLRLPAMLYHPETKWDSSALKEFDVYSIATPDNRNPIISGDEAKQRLLKAADHWAVLKSGNETAFIGLKKTILSLSGDVKIPRYIGSSAKGGVQSRLFALLLFKYVETSEFTFGLLKESFPAATDFSILSNPPRKQEGVDPIKLARGTPQRGATSSTRSFRQRDFRNHEAGAKHVVSRCRVEFQATRFQES